jgi:hypothetical protein
LVPSGVADDDAMTQEGRSLDIHFS